MLPFDDSLETMIAEVESPYSKRAGPRETLFQGQRIYGFHCRKTNVRIGTHPAWNSNKGLKESGTYYELKSSDLLRLKLASKALVKHHSSNHIDDLDRGFLYTVVDRMDNFPFVNLLAKKDSPAKQ